MAGEPVVNQPLRPTPDRPSRIPPFQNGLGILSTPHFNAVYGYKDESGPKDKRNQRVYLVPADRRAEVLLVQFAKTNNNATSDKPFGEPLEDGTQPTIKAIRFNGDARELVKVFKSKDSRDGGFMGGGVPSVEEFEQILADPESYDSLMRDAERANQLEEQERG